MDSARRVGLYVNGLSGITTAQPGWRVVFFKSRDPWIEVRPIVCWGLYRFGAGDMAHVQPLIRSMSGSSIERADPDKDHEIAGPDESDESFVEKAKELQRWYRRMYYQRRKARLRKEAEKKSKGDSL